MVGVDQRITSVCLDHHPSPSQRHLRCSTTQILQGHLRGNGCPRLALHSLPWCCIRSIRPVSTEAPIPEPRNQLSRIWSRFANARRSGFVGLRCRPPGNARRRQPPQPHRALHAAGGAELVTSTEFRSKASGVDTIGKAAGAPSRNRVDQGEVDGRRQGRGLRHGLGDNTDPTRKERGYA